MPTTDELRILQALPLDMKIRRTQQRIREWVDYYGVNGVYVSFSGGKDSTVLLHLVRELYPNIEAVFVNTGLEYPEIQQFAKSFENVTIIRPAMRFDEVISKYGYPIIGKEVAEKIKEARNGGIVALARFNSDSEHSKKYGMRFCFEKYKPLLKVDFKIANTCCNVIKKLPLKHFERKSGKNRILATIAEESALRKTKWLEFGCNAFNSNRPYSAPMSFWTEQDVLAYIKAYNLPIADVYGEVVYDNRGLQYADTLCTTGGKLCTTGCNRTGCIFCGFGAHLDKGESRFERLKRTHPQQYEYCLNGGAYDADGLWKPTKEGLGMRHVFEEVNKIYGKNFIRY